MKRRKILLRADGNSKIGLGHVYRLLAIAEMLKDCFECIYVINKPDSFLVEEIKKVCADCWVLDNPDEEMKPFQEKKFDLQNHLSGDEIVVLDGYNFGPLYQQQIKAKGCKLVCLDDLGEIAFYADIVINHAGSAIANRYKIAPYTKLLLGFDYLILKNEFLLAAQEKSRSTTKIETAFICMGGADPFDVTIKALTACMQVGSIKNIIVVTGSAYKNYDRLSGIALERGSEKNIQLRSKVDAAGMVALIQQAQIAICPASSVALEVCCVKCGLLTGTVADNQNQLHALLKKEECCVSLEAFNHVTVQDITIKIEGLCDVVLVQEMIAHQAKAIDGWSGKRLHTEINSLAEC